MKLNSFLDRALKILPVTRNGITAIIGLQSLPKRAKTPIARTTPMPALTQATSPSENLDWLQSM